MKYGSVCSGIEAATLAWHGLDATMCVTCEGLGKYAGHVCGECKGQGLIGGWTPQWFSEIEKFPSALLKHHYPHVPNLGDMTKLKELKEFRERTIELLVGGTPCQSFSVAGLRKGMDDPRGNLALHFLGLVDAARPRWVVWENVPGVLSSSGGRDFGAFLGGLGQLGYGWAYRVLDAQYFGVPQRRRRVFVVGHLGDWRAAASVLFECQSLQGHPAPSRKSGQGPTPILEAGARTGKSTTDPRAGIGIAEAGNPMFTLQRGKQHAVADIAKTLRGAAGDPHKEDASTYVTEEPSRAEPSRAFFIRWPRP